MEITRHASVAHNEKSERLRMKAAAALDMSEFLDRERNRIARDLHDSVAQHLLSIGMNLEWCMQAEGTPAAVGHRLAVCKKLAQQGVTHIRRSIFELSSPDEDRFGLRIALQDLVQDFMKTAQLEVSLRFVGSAVPLPAETEHALFQVAQEAMFNVVKHSLATRASIELRYEADKFVGLVVADDGFGDPRALRKHLERRAGRPTLHHRGLRNIADRVRELNGVLVIRRRRGGGVSLTVRVPMAAADPEPMYGSRA
jgi:signal transduction histidine kinase